MAKGFVEHSFYCINCGKKGIPLQRRTGHKHGKFHMKKLYCLYCKQEVNHIECSNAVEVKKFKENFLKGVYKNDAKESLTYVGAERRW